MFVNCAHGKGIKFIREDIKFFAKTNIQTNSGMFFKTIILMNAVFLTIDAQSALRRCIELFSYNTRFFIIVENKHKLLNPILSRFCEIYVPEFLQTKVKDKKNCKFVNLHQLEINKNVELINYNNNKLDYVYNEIKRIYEAKDNINIYINVCEILYDLGISCLDIMNFIELNKYLFFNEKQIVNSLMKFYQIKKDFRNEKLLMLFMLQYVFQN
jgi:hypothetical protein